MLDFLLELPRGEGKGRKIGEEGGPKAVHHQTKGGDLKSKRAKGEGFESELLGGGNR
jgi:hypothetical protein